MNPNQNQYFAFYFATGILVIAGLYAWQEWLFLPPYSVHQWRQADGAALAWNYYQNFSFFSPQIQNLQTKGDSGAVGELPLTYFLAGGVGKIVGYKIYWLRWVHLVLFFTSLFIYGKTLLALRFSLFYALFLSFFLLLSPLIAYYSPNYLPDNPALALILMAISFCIKSYLRGNYILFGFATLFAIMSVGMKMSMIIIPASFYAWILITTLFDIDFPLKNRISKSMLILSFWGFMGSVFLIRNQISHYNFIHGSYYFLAATRPIWNYSLTEIMEILNGIKQNVQYSYGSLGFYLLFLGGIIAFFYERKQILTAWKWGLGLLLGGNVMIFVLWFRMFKEHDYYATCLMIFPLLLITIICFYIPKPPLRVKIVMVLWALLGVFQVSYHQKTKLKNGAIHHAYLAYSIEIFSIAPDSLIANYIPQNAVVLCPEDLSPNTLLLALNRKGYTYQNFGDRLTTDTLHKYQHQFQMNYLALTQLKNYQGVLPQFFPDTLLNWKGKLWIFGKKEDKRLH